MNSRRRVNSNVRRYFCSVAIRMTRKIFLRIVLASVTALTLSCGQAYPSQRLVHDVKTGQYLGVLRGECKVWEKGKSKETITYRVERSDGTTVDLPSDKVTITEQ
jgi:hypothetical protein